MTTTGRKTILEISTNRRNEIKQQVYDTLVKYGTPVLPMKIGALIRNIKHVKLITYSSQIKKYGITYDELILDAETKDSYAVRQGSTGRYCIYYNDIDRNIVTSNRVRWNLAHELGHVILNHHELIGADKLYRKGLNDDAYYYFEQEANYFAQLILVPHAALLGFKVDSARNIRVMCKISDPAAKRRFYDFQIWKTHVNASDEYDNRIFRYYYDFIFKRKCNCCGTGLVQRYGKHCPICGSKNTLEWGDGDKMKYPLLPTHESKKLKECPKCKNEETEITGNYCQICGISLVNMCTNPGCSNTNILPSNARFCPICGEQSTFFEGGILLGWKAVTSTPTNLWDLRDNIIDEELPFN